jgi:hypothetical protein
MAVILVVCLELLVHGVPFHCIALCWTLSPHLRTFYREVEKSCRVFRFRREGRLCIPTFPPSSIVGYSRRPESDRMQGCPISMYRWYGQCSEFSQEGAATHWYECTYPRWRRIAKMCVCSGQSLHGVPNQMLIEG